MFTPCKYPPNRGFTLIELLTVIAIIGILAAIIIPTVGRVRESANAAVCSSNLRQIGLAVQLYTNERGHFPPSISGATTPDDGPSGRLWQQNLRPYMNATNIVNNGQAQLNSRVLLCPSRGLKSDTTDINTSYSANPLIMPSMVESTSKLLRAGGVNQPSQVILMADSPQQSNERANSNLFAIPAIFSAGLSLAETPLPTQVVKDGDGTATLIYRHNNQVNVVFADSHVNHIKNGSVLYRNVRNY